MKTHSALELSSKVAELVQLCATFQAKFGRYHSLKPGSSEDAWALYHQILNQQVEIAMLLDERALDMPHTAHHPWWERQDTLDLSVAKTLIQHAGHLIATCTYHESDDQETDWSYAVYCAQSTIAGLLHPNARQVALSSIQVKSERYAG